MEPNRIRPNEHLSSVANVTHSETEIVSRCGLKVRHLSRISLCSLTLADRASPHPGTQKVIGRNHTSRITLKSEKTMKESFSGEREKQSQRWDLERNGSQEQPTLLIHYSHNPQAQKRRKTEWSRRVHAPKREGLHEYMRNTLKRSY